MADCDNCGAPLRIDRNRALLICDHCGSQQEAPAILEHLELLSESSRLCPLCSVPLSHSRLHGHTLLCCPQCFGMLIEMGHFTTIIDAVRVHEAGAVRLSLPRSQNPSDREITCPMCGEPMIGHDYGGPGNVVIDTCERCLVNWLDQGELRRIAMASDRANSD